MKFEVFVTIDDRFFDDEKHLIPHWEVGLEEILSPEFLKLTVLEADKAICQITFVEKYLSKKQTHLFEFPALAFTILLTERPIEVTEYNGPSKKVTQSIEGFAWAIQQEFEDKIRSFFYVSHLAKPGVFRALDADSYIDGKYHSSVEIGTSIHRESYDAINKIGWPKYKFLELKQAWKWYVKLDYPFERLAKTKVEIALNAYSYLFDSNK